MAGTADGSELGMWMFLWGSDYPHDSLNFRQKVLPTTVTSSAAGTHQLPLRYRPPEPVPTS